MGRRIRLKTRPKPSSIEGETSKRIKIRRGRAGSAFEQIIESAKKEAAKVANFKGFKAGVKSGIKKEKKRSEQIDAELTTSRRMLERHDREAMTLSGRLRQVEKALSAIVHAEDVEDESTYVVLRLNSNGIRLQKREEQSVLATNKWRFLWGDEATAGIVRDTDGIDRSQSTMTRHRHHPGRQIPRRPMHEIWDALAEVEVPDVDPMQGMRRTWYWNRRRYSSHGAAMNAWRRHMHRRMEARVIPEGTPSSFIPVAEDDEPEDIFDDEPTQEESDNVDELNPPEIAQPGHDIERRRANMRNRINQFLRSCELESCRYWTRHASLNLTAIEEARDAQVALNPFLAVCWAFTQPLEHWDNDRFHTFRTDVNYYLEVVQNRGAEAAGTPTTRRRRRAARAGYNRSNY